MTDTDREWATVAWPNERGNLYVPLSTAQARLEERTVERDAAREALDDVAAHTRAQYRARLDEAERERDAAMAAAHEVATDQYARAEKAEAERERLARALREIANRSEVDGYPEQIVTDLQIIARQALEEEAK